MVQKEVGDRFKAVPGTKSYNSLTIFINYYYEVSKVMDVSRNVFSPKPNVDSIVLSMIKKKKNNNIAMIRKKSERIANAMLNIKH